MSTAETVIATAAADDAVYKKISYRIIPLLIICFIVGYYDRVNIAFAKLQMQQELKFSETVYALGASLFFVGYILFEVPSNVILHRVGARKWIARIMVSWGVAVAGGIAFINSMGNLGSFFSPTFIGWVTDLTKSTQLSVNVIGATMIVAGLLIALFWPFTAVPGRNS
jgi:nitrate/nitrite transporter NarK